jgi:hypothetical protein
MPDRFTRREELVMRRRGKVLAAATAMAVILGAALGVSASQGVWAAPADKEGGTAAGSLSNACPAGADSRARTTEIATAKLIIEFNSTDGDLGVHGAFDDQGWKTLCVFAPNGRPVLEVGPQGQLRDLTMAGIFFESREPPISEFSFADLKAAFPEGEYTVRAESFDGTILVGSATFTHDVPASPTITSPQIADDPRGAKRNPVARDNLVVAWDRVTRTVDGGPVNITGYEVIITKEVADDPHGFSRPTNDVHVPATANSLSVPREFLEGDTVYELEVLALEVSGNQPLSVGFFKTA